MTVSTANSSIILTIIIGALLTSIYQYNPKKVEQKVEDEGRFDTTNELEVESQAVLEKSNITCMTPACFQATYRILMNIDQSVEPCDDFYKFACGRFLQETHIPEGGVKVDVFTLMKDEMQEQLREPMGNPITPDDPRHVQLVKNLYQSCLNKQALEEQRFKPVMKIMEKMGGWPVLMGDRWNESDFHWIKSVYRCRHEGYFLSHFFDISIDVDMNNSSRRIIQLDQPHLGLPREIFTDGIKFEFILEAYRDYMIDVAVHFGASEEVATKELNNSLEFEKQLAAISLPEKKRGNITALYNPMTISQLSSRYPSIPWKIYINRLLTFKAIVNDDDIVNVMVPSYLDDFVKLMNTTSPRAQANYAMWRIAMESVPYLDEVSREPLSKYLKKLDADTKSEIRWKSCMDIVTETLSLGLSSLYVKTFFPVDAKESAVEIVNNINDEFNDILKMALWMDADTRRYALHKSASMSLQIGYPDEILDDNKVDEVYQDLELSDDNFLQNMLNLRIFGTDLLFGKLKATIDKNDWAMRKRSVMIEDFSIPTENSIRFPAAIFQGLLFNKDYPKYVNYGGIGYVVGHEIAKGFGNYGHQFNENGNQNDWWTASTHEKFKREAECFIDQYGNYTDSEVGMHLNSISTLDNNIADNGAIKAAYSAYERWTSVNGEEPSLPWLAYTPKQLFWISAANVQCSKYHTSYLKAKLRSQQSSPGEFRVLGPFSNMINFATDFNCPKKSKMHPSHKCTLW